MMELAYKLIPNSGKTILFLHGFLGSSAQWSPVVDHFKNSHQILLVELPGHGICSINKSYTITEIAASINKVLQENQIDDVHFVGHSMGGYVGCAFAKAYPEKIASLHLINSCAEGDPASRRLQRDRAIELVKRFPDAFVSMAVGNLFTESERQEFEEEITAMKSGAMHMTGDAIIHALVAMRDRESQLEQLVTSNFPVHYIYGKQDAIIPVETVQLELELLKVEGYKMDAGHMSIVTHPLKLTRIMQFIE